MDLTLIIALSVFSLVILGFGVFVLLSQRGLQDHLSALQDKVSLLDAKFAESEHQLKVTHDNLHEVHAGSLGVGNKVKDLSLQVQRIEDKLQELEQLDPDTRLYSKATRLVNEGASVEELMQECELPRAEAELLMSLRKA